MRAAPVVATLILALVACTGTGAGQDARKPKPAGELPQIKELPNPFLFADGSPVRTVKEWERRRVEIKDLFQDYMYGHMPRKPEKMSIKKGEKITDETNNVILQDLEVQLEHEGKNLTIK